MHKIYAENLVNNKLKILNIVLFNIIKIGKSLNYSDIFKSSLNKLKIEGTYRHFNEIERKAGKHPNAFWISDSKKNDIIVWCSNDYLGMSQNKLVINSMINSV